MDQWTPKKHVLSHPNCSPPPDYAFMEGFPKDLYFLNKSWYKTEMERNWPLPPPFHHLEEAFSHTYVTQWDSRLRFWSLDLPFASREETYQTKLGQEYLDMFINRWLCLAICGHFDTKYFDWKDRVRSVIREIKNLPLHQRSFLVR